MKKIIQSIEVGWSLGGEERKLEAGEWGVLKVSAVTSGRFLANEYKSVGYPEFKKKPLVPKRGDLLFGRANTKEMVGATCLVEASCNQLFLPDKLWRINTYQGIAKLEYIKFLFSSSSYQKLISRRATGTSGSMLNISQANLLSMLGPLPPFSLQEKFAEIVWQDFNLRANQEQTAQKSNNLFNSLLQRAFKGQL